jgi:hypothetical protein
MCWTMPTFLTRSRTTVLALLVGAAGCSGGQGAASDGGPRDGSGKSDRVDAHRDEAAAGGHGGAADSGDSATDAARSSDATPRSDAGSGVPDAAHDATVAHDAAPDGATSAMDGSVDGDAAVPPVTFIVDATMNFIALDACGVTPALFAAVPAGSYTIDLVASTLSKGGVSGTDPNMPTPSVDNYVIVNLPLPIGDPQSADRFFMLNGIGASAAFSLPLMGSAGVMFIDSDTAANTGQATVTLEPGDASATVDAVANVIPWQTGCMSTPVQQVVSGQPHRITLVSSTLSAEPGSEDDYVLVRIPDETPANDHRFIMLNGIGASYDFTPFNSQTVRAWFIAASGGATGQATLSVSNL